MTPLDQSAKSIRPAAIRYQPKGLRLFFETNLSNHGITSKEVIKAASVATARERSTSLCRMLHSLLILYATAPPRVGTDKINEKAVAVGLLKPVASPPTMVAPDLETPGTSASS